MPRIFFPQFESSDDLPPEIKKVADEAINDLRDAEAHATFMTNVSKPYLEQLLQNMEKAAQECKNASPESDSPPSAGDHLKGALSAALFMMQEFHKEGLSDCIQGIKEYAKTHSTESFDEEEFESRLASVVQWAMDAATIDATKKPLMRIDLP